jgi:putative membrane protein
MVLTLIFIPLAVIWVLGLGQWWARHYFEKLRCELSEHELKFRKGILFQVEKTIPLENIQDVTFVEGPLLRQFHLSTLKFETAGNSPGQAHNMTLTGIVDAHDFRDQIMQRRKAMRQRSSSPATTDDEQIRLLRGISQRLDEVATLMRDRSAP